MQGELPFIRSQIHHRKKTWIVFLAVFFVLLFLIGRLVYLMVFCSEYYGQKAENLHERERDIKAARGRIIDATGTVLATNQSVCTISVIHSQITEPQKVIDMLVKELALTEEEVRKRVEKVSSIERIKTNVPISVIHSQITEPQKVIDMLVKELALTEEEVRKRVEKVSSIERIKTNVPKETGDRIRDYGLAGVKVDEDYKRYYPYESLGSKVLGFTGADNQGIIGLEVTYDSYMQGTNGKILTLTDARGIEIENAGETRMEPVNGNDLYISMDVNIQQYCEQAAEKAYRTKNADGVSIIVMNPQNGELMAMVNYPEFKMDVNIQQYCEQAAEKAYRTKNADGVSIIVMNPQNGELMAMVNYPEFNLNEPFTLTGMEETAAAYRTKNADGVSIIVMNPQNGELMAMVNYPEFNLNEPFTLTGMEETAADGQERQALLNQMWRNPCISDTYEPGSTFKIITAAAALEEDVVTLADTFFCPGYKMVEDRRIRCAKTTGHGAETFETGIMNSCNPVFIELGERLGTDNYYRYFEQFGLTKKTAIDLPGEAATIMHKKENVGPVELATISFGQSFQITPIQLVTTVSSIINGGTRVTPHFGVEIRKEDGTLVETLEYETTEFQITPIQLVTTVSSIINGGTRVTPHFGVEIRKEDGTLVETLEYETTENICSAETSETMQYLLEKVVSEGGGKNAKIEGYSIGGKTATSQTLPRSENRYISSFLGFAPADDPKVLVLAIIDNPEGTYYGGLIAAPVVKEIMENILPYLDK